MNNIEMSEFEGCDLYTISSLEQFLLIKPESVPLFLADIAEHYALMQDFLLKVLMMGEHIESIAHMVPMMNDFMWLDDPERDSTKRILLPLRGDATEGEPITVMSIGDLQDQIAAALAMAEAVQETTDPEQFAQDILEGAGIDVESDLGVHIKETVADQAPTVN